MENQETVWDRSARCGEWRAALPGACGYALRFWRDQDGQTLVLAAVCLVVLVGMLALSIDAGVLRYQKRQLQTLADATALAAVLESSTCGKTSNCSTMQVAATDALLENKTTSSLLLNCAARSGSVLELTVNNPPCALPGDPNSGNAAYVETVVSKPVTTVFAQVLGLNAFSVMARAEAALRPSL